MGQSPDSWCKTPAATNSGVTLVRIRLRAFWIYAFSVLGRFCALTKCVTGSALREGVSALKAAADKASSSGKAIRAVLFVHEVRTKGQRATAQGDFGELLGALGLPLWLVPAIEAAELAPMLSHVSALLDG